MENGDAIHGISRRKDKNNCRGSFWPACK
ncbi:MAG: hypothetical protein DWH94_11930 [Planctomycetota bacterium]|nr:MAG: hypothetical protein DWH94_11930 [Planctomycetota bacterium]